MKKHYPVGPWMITGFASVGFEYEPRVVIEALRRRFRIPRQGTGETVFKAVVQCCVRREFPKRNKRLRKKSVNRALRLYERYNTLPQYVMAIYWGKPAKLIDH